MTAELKDLIQLSSKGCRTSFEELYRRTCGRLFGVILRVNNDRSQAEEVLQETYFKIWHLSKQFDPNKEQAMYWLVSVARNGAIGSLRYQAAPPKRGFAHLNDKDDKDDQCAALSSSEAGPLEVLVLRRRAAAVQRSLRALPSDARACLTFAYYDGLTCEEVAACLSRPTGTVKNLVRRSLIGLRTSLGAEHCPDDVRQQSDNRACGQSGTDDGSRRRAQGFAARPIGQRQISSEGPS